MDGLFLVIICSLIGGLFSLAGGIILITRQRTPGFIDHVTSFAAGALLAAAFADLLPEALETGDAEQVMVFTLIGLLAFFVLESSVRWFHHHHARATCQHTDPVVPMIIVGDTVHNALDGVAIAAGFLVSPLSGIIVTLAVAIHEIPQEIGDFGLLLKKGVKRHKIIWINIFSALATTASAIIFYTLGQATEISLAPVLGLVAGFFIYIAVSDIIPSIHGDKNRTKRLVNSGILIGATALVYFLIEILHGFME
jgi:zinc and cadmium transporter